MAGGGNAKMKEGGSDTCESDGILNAFDRVKSEKQLPLGLHATDL
jgi:hypothetical protein